MAASFGTRFEKKPILAWAIDDWETFYEAMAARNVVDLQLDDYLQKYKEDTYNKDILPLYTEAPLSLNLGGDTEKTKIIPTDKSTGIFDFSLASIGLYKVPEYYSAKLEKEQPNKFIEFDLPSGVIPPDLVQQTSIGGQPSFFYKDPQNNEIYNCVIRQKGETAIEQGVVGAQKKFATLNKKVYLTYKRNKGRVKYVEIYSLFYYGAFSNPTQYAIRHIPAMMVADYLESKGVKTRFYMTRYVELYNTQFTLREKTPLGVVLPMYDLAPKKTNYQNLFVQPIIVKDYGEEFDKALAFLVSDGWSRKVYEKAATYAIEKEVEQKITNVDRDLYGDPSFDQSEYYEGFDRYRNKYKMYTDLGIVKAKEVSSEALLFFHDVVINDSFSSFMSSLRDYFPPADNDINILTNLEINPFFLWWMRISANTLRDKIDIINSREIKKDLIAINKRLFDVVAEYKSIVVDIKKTPSRYQNRRNLQDYIKDWGNRILKDYKILDYQGDVSYKNYILQITEEVTTYAENKLFASTKESQEVRNGILKDDILAAVLTELKTL